MTRGKGFAVFHPTLLRNNSTRPPGGNGLRVARELFGFICFFCTDRQATPTAPFRRVSGIAVEGVERHGCRESRDGPGMALRGVPLEWRWSERTRSEAQGRMEGQALLVPFGATAKRDPPSGAEQMPEATRKRSEQVEVTRGKGFAVFHPTQRRCVGSVGG